MIGFPLNVYLLAFLGAALVSLVSLPFWRDWCQRLGLVDDPGGRKTHDKTIPLAGGLAVFTGFFFPLLAAVLALKFRLLEFHAVNLISYGFSHRTLQLAAILGGAGGMLVLGLVDDRIELRPAVKFSAQFILAALVAAAGVRITLFVPNLAFSYAITILWIVTLTNAFNFMDNMNGLCAGLGLISAWFFALIAAASGQYLVALLAFLTTGALLGFLPYNFPRASAFLGDSGSHLVGFLLSVLAILPHFYTAQHPRVLATLAPLLILGVTLGDLAWVVLIRWRLGKPFYIGDQNHLSHRLVRRGLTKPRAVLIIWLLQAVAAALATW